MQQPCFLRCRDTGVRSLVVEQRTLADQRLSRLTGLPDTISSTVIAQFLDSVRPDERSAARAAGIDVGVGSQIFSCRLTSLLEAPVSAARE